MRDPQLLLLKARLHLDEDEKELASIVGSQETDFMGSPHVRRAAVLATDSRVLLFAKKLGGFNLESFPYDHISSFEVGKNLAGHQLRLFTVGNEVRIKRIRDENFEDFLDIVRSKITELPQ